MAIYRRRTFARVGGRGRHVRRVAHGQPRGPVAHPTRPGGGLPLPVPVRASSRRRGPVLPPGLPGAHILRLSEPWVWWGDFNVLARAEEALPWQAMGRKDENFAAMVGELRSGAAPPDGACAVGLRVRLKLEAGDFTFRRGLTGSNIDHVVVPAEDFGSWESVRTLPPQALRPDGSSVPLSDHAFVHVWRLQPVAALLGPERLVRFETKRSWRTCMSRLSGAPPPRHGVSALEARPLMRSWAGSAPRWWPPPGRWSRSVRARLGRRREHPGDDLRRG